MRSVQKLNTEYINLKITKKLKYAKQNKEKINEYKNDSYKTDSKFQLFRKTRSRINKARKRTSKSSLMKEILGIDIETYKKWIEFQMTPDMTWDNTEIDHVKPICLLDVSKAEELKEALNWESTEP